MTLGAGTVAAQIFGNIRGTVEDPAEMRVPEAQITLRATTSDYTRDTQTDDGGEFILSAVPAGSYTITVERPGFQALTQALNVAINSAPILHFTLQVSAVTTSVDVSAPLELENAGASSRPVTVDRLDIQHTPGATRTQSLAFITNFTPGTYLLHDHLHMRGGHQVTWLVDGVPIPNTNISSNVGRAMDPKDMDTVEVSRGGYNSRYGDRTYGMINIIPRSGYEFPHHEATLTATYGSLHQTNDQLNFGGHGDKLAYYGSVTGSRTDLGLEPPTEHVIHNMGSALAGFTTLEYFVNEKNQIRLAASLRKDHYQVPNFPADQAIGVRDVNQEIDSFANFSWVHTFTPGAVLTTSPLYHYNAAQYVGGPNDPLITNDRRTSNYVGLQSTLTIVHGRHNMNAGIYGFMEHDDRRFSLADQEGFSASDRQPVTGGVGSAFLDDQFRPWQWLTFNLGLRLTHFSGLVNENAANPRVGATVQIPKLRWVLRGFIGTYYQPPPLETVGGRVLQYAVRQGIGFLPVRGERDQQHEFGITVPFHGWTFDFANFRTWANNFSDHSVLGNSNITLPLAIENAVIRGYEGVIRSPQMFRTLNFHLSYSNQVVKGRGIITGGLIDFKAPAEGYFYIDHDQRHTLSVGGELALPGSAWMNTNMNWGSGFLDLNGPQHLPPHTQVDIAFGKSFTDNLSMTLSVLNIGNSRFLYGRESAFAATHYNDPRQIIGSVQYRFAWF